MASARSPGSCFDGIHHETDRTAEAKVSLLLYQLLESPITHRFIEIVELEGTNEVFIQPFHSVREERHLAR